MVKGRKKGRKNERQPAQFYEPQIMDDVVLQLLNSLVERAERATDPSFQAFRSAWLQTDLPLIFELRLDTEPMDLFLDRMFCYYVDLLMNLNPYQSRVLFAWLVFALYALYRGQPGKPRYRIPLAWNDWSGYVRLLKFASQSPDLADAWFALYQLHKDGALKYCVARRCPHLAPSHQLTPLPLHRLVDVDVIRKSLEDYDQEVAGFGGELDLKTAQIFDALEEIEEIVSFKPIEAIPATNPQPETPPITESNLDVFNAIENENDPPLFLSYRREDDQSSTDYDEADPVI